MMAGIEDMRGDGIEDIWGDGIDDMLRKVRKTNNRMNGQESLETGFGPISVM